LLFVFEYEDIYTFPTSCPIQARPSGTQLYFVWGSFAIQIVSKLIERKEIQKVNRREKGAGARWRWNFFVMYSSLSRRWISRPNAAGLL